MRRVLLAVALVACGGQLAIESDDAGVDAAKKDATKDTGGVKDVSAPVDVVVLDQITPEPKCAGLPTQLLFAYYPLDQDTGDHTGHGFDALGSNLAPAAGVVGGAMHFDGTTSSIHVTNGSSYLKGPRTLCAWSLETNPAPGLGEPLFWAGTTGQGDFFSLSAMAPSGGTCPAAPPNTPFIDHWGSPCVVGPAPPLMPMKWNFVCYAYDGASVTFFVDGMPTPPVPTALYDYPMTTLFLGSTLGNGTTTQASFDGDLDEVTVWITALSVNEMMSLWNNGAGCAAL